MGWIGITRKANIDNVDDSVNNFNMRKGHFALTSKQYERAGWGTHLARAGQSFGYRAQENAYNTMGMITKHQLKTSPLTSRFMTQVLGGGFVAYGALHGDSISDVAGYTLPFGAAAIVYAPFKELGHATGKLLPTSFGRGLGKVLGYGAGLTAAAIFGGAAYGATQMFNNNNIIQETAAKINRGGYISRSGETRNTLTHRQKMLNKLSKSGLNDRGALLGNEAAIIRGVL